MPARILRPDETEAQLTFGERRSDPYLNV